MSKIPQPVLDSIFAFPPNRDTLGGTSYLIVGNPWNILIDCPPWTPQNQAWLVDQGKIHGLVLTQRQGISAQIAQIQQALDCPVVIQEQEAYLLGGLPVTSFQETLRLNDDLHLLWTPGYSPGAACVYDRRSGGCLFTGRHLLPNPQGQLMPIRTAKTFHWLRQLQSLQRLQSQFSAQTLQFILPGAHVGFLRGQRAIAQAYEALRVLDASELSHTEVGTSTPRI